MGNPYDGSPRRVARNGKNDGIVPIAPKTAGKVVKVNVVQDQLVKAGDLLVKIDPDEHALAVQQAEAALELAILCLLTPRLKRRLGRQKRGEGDQPRILSWTAFRVRLARCLARHDEAE
jgi:multidrug efflux pump subunit AcrA (membrane-fusion protein)